MKLELELSSAEKVSVENASAKQSAEVKETLRKGIQMAKDGNRVDARHLLLKATEIDPENETAWMWLASISEYPEELLVFLQNVLKINPENAKAVEWAQATKSLLSNTFVQRGIGAAHENQKDFAKQCFLQAIVYDSENEMAWLWLASVAETPEEKISNLQKVLSINPENETAASSLAALKSQDSEAILKQAASAAIAGEKEAAQELLKEVLSNTPDSEEALVLKAYLAEDFYEKLAAYEKVLDINPENESALAGVASLKVLLNKATKPEVTPQPEPMQEAQPDEEFVSYERVDDEDASHDQFSDELAFEAAHPELFADIAESFDEDVQADASEQPELSSPEPESQPHFNYELKEELEAEEEDYLNGYKSDFEFSEADPFADDARQMEELANFEAQHAAVEPQADSQPEMQETSEPVAEQQFSAQPAPMIEMEDLHVAENQPAMAEAENEVDSFDSTEHEEAYAAPVEEAVEQQEASVEVAPVEAAEMAEPIPAPVEAMPVNDLPQHAAETAVASKTILVVDDSPTVRKLITGKLEKSGHSVLAAVDGMDALAKINEVTPDLILLDITMPRLDGYQVCKLIRGNESTKDVPVVMISGKDGFFDKMRGRMAGCSGYITKPFGPDTLMKAVETYIA